MLLKPVYATGQELVDNPLTDAPCEWAPQSGVHLYHFPLSLDSQKARQGLEELKVKWQSHVILTPAQQQFSPRYARINSRCVVPTLVIDGKVTTDTINILSHLADRFGDRINPLHASEDEQTTVNHWVNKAAALFMEALTYGHVDGIEKPFPFRQSHGDGQYHQSKLDLLSTLIDKYQDEETLRLAYEKKRAVIEATQEAIVSPEQLTAIIESTKVELDELEGHLATGPFRGGGWLASNSFSLADIQWGPVLYRLRWLGLQPLLWEEDSRLTAYAERLFARKSFQRGVLAWSNIGRNVVLPLLRHKLLTAVGFNRDR
jgi:glutathione S-transferase